MSWGDRVGSAGAREELGLGDHVCVFTESVDQRVDAMAAVVAAGLRGGDLVMVVTDCLPPPELAAGLVARGVAVTAGLRSGHVQLVSARDVYLPTGRFEFESLYESMAGLVTQTLAAGYPGLRLVADMTWTLAAPAGLGQLAGYEAAVNRLLLDGQAFGACLYDRRGLDADLVRAVTCAHPATTSRFHPAWEPLLRIRRSQRPYGLALAGEVDASNRQALFTALDAIADELPDRAAPIVIDVNGLRFADAASGGALAELAGRAPAGVRVVGCHGAVAVVLDQLDVGRLPGVELLPADPDPEERGR